MRNRIGLVIGLVAVCVIGFASPAFANHVTTPTCGGITVSNIGGTQTLTVKNASHVTVLSETGHNGFYQLPAGAYTWAFDQEGLSGTATVTACPVVTTTTTTQPTTTTTTSPPTTTTTKPIVTTTTTQPVVDTTTTTQPVVITTTTPPPVVTTTQPPVVTTTKPPKVTTTTTAKPKVPPTTTGTITSPPALPHTGSGTGPLVALGIVLVLFGVTLVLSQKARRPS